MKKLEGKIAVITGGSSGIGLATAQRFVDEGVSEVIRVNAISPGPIDTSIFNSAVQTEEEIEQIKASLVASVPMG
jgi:NAD(P)-dependent dehydrogenase (short-subunit alcohol dehydrogenase family)